MRPSTRVVAALALLVVGAGVAFAGASPDEHRTVTDVVATAGVGPGDEVEVKATVANGTYNASADPPIFLLTDGRNELLVRYHGTIPTERVDGTLEGRTAVVGGTLADEDGTLVLDGTSLELGCASKYESEG
jgi:cytochrome c-type biogenesis protein CcmE